MCYKQKCKVVSLNLAHPVRTERRCKGVTRNEALEYRCKSYKQET